MRSCSSTSGFVRVTSCALLAAALIGFVPAGSRAEAPAPLPPGQKAPQFEAVTLEGAPFSLKETLAGGPIALIFWSILCGSCREELPLLQQALPSFEAAKVRLFGMNLDQATHKTPVQKFVSKGGFTFPMLLNESGERTFGVEQIYQVVVTPAFFLIGSDGTILYSHYGPLEPEQLEPEVFSKLPK